MLAFKSVDHISISNNCQNFYMLKSNIGENQNLKPIYFKFQILKLKTQNSKFRI